MKPDTLINILSPERIAVIVRDTLHHRGELPPDEQATLEETVRDLLARNAGPFVALSKDPAFTELHPALAAQFFQRAHDLARSKAQREWIAARAKELGFGEVQPPLPDQSASPLTASQERAFVQLRALAVLFFRGTERKGISLRTQPLICGPSGVGKTELVARLGRFLGLDVVRLTVSDWIPSGARAEPQTLRVIHQQIKTGKRLLIHLDELCKFRGSPEPWCQAQLTEVFHLLDTRIALPAWSPADREALAKNVFIVGTATFQEVWERSFTRPVGFNPSSGAFDFEQQVRKANLIPAELLRRFGRWLILEPLTTEDFRSLAQRLQLAPSILDPEIAAASGAGFRAVENAVTDHALREVLDELSNEPEKSTALNVG